MGGNLVLVTERQILLVHFKPTFGYDKYIIILMDVNIFNNQRFILRVQDMAQLQVHIITQDNYSLSSQLINDGYQYTSKKYRYNLI